MYRFSSITSIRSFEKGLQQETSMRDKVKEYIDELDMEIKRLENQLEDHMNGEACMVTEIESRLQTLIEVKNDLLGRLDEVI